MFSWTLSVQVGRKKYKVSQSECTEYAQALFCKVGALGLMGLLFPKGMKKNVTMRAMKT